MKDKIVKFKVVNKFLENFLDIPETSKIVAIRDCDDESFWIVIRDDQFEEVEIGVLEDIPIVRPTFNLKEKTLISFLSWN